MKNILKQMILLIITLMSFLGCQEDDNVFGDINSPTGLQVTSNIVGKDAINPNGDGSGKVNFIARANDAISYKYIFSDGSSENSPSGILEKRFTTNGVNTYTVTVLANGKAGISSSISFEVTVKSDFKDDQAVQFLTGGSQKTWYWSASEPGHLGVGPNNTDATQNYFPLWYSAAPFEKAASPESSCLYDNELKFFLDGGVLKYTLDNKGKTFFNVAFNNVVGATSSSDGCYNYNVSGTKVVSLSPSESVVVGNNIPNQTRGTLMTFSDGGFMGYYIGQNKYEILSITNNRMVVRAVMGGNDAIAWYHTFTTTKPSQSPSQDFTNLVWQDEFNVDGAPDSSKWTYDLGAGGWGNNEQQNYTNSPSNIIVSGGTLKITAKKENVGGSQYTSARIKTQGIYDFKYGKVVVRAKLPTGAGTWPAIWMLGSNISTVPWPGCGEIDIMEHVGNQQNKIFGSLHYPGNSGGNSNTGTTDVSTASSEFHEYSVIWTDTSIKFYVDNVQFHSFVNSASVPFNNNFFLILNQAMGGNFGGSIDPNFTQSTFEIDYVKVYQ